MTQKIRVCLFGAGEMATIHAMNLISDPRVTLAYVVDPSAERADSLAQATGARVVDLDTAFGDPTLDAYLIASPPRTHADYLERAAATRSYVFCEKPIDHDMGRILTCMKAWKGREGRVQLGFNRRFAELWAMPLALLQQREAAVLGWMADAGLAGDVARRIDSQLSDDERRRILATAVTLSATAMTSGEHMKRHKLSLFQ